MTELLPRWHPDTLRAAAWAWSAARRAKGLSASAPEGLDRLRVPRPPDVGAGAVRGVLGVLDRRGERCLVRSAVLQAWYAAHGHPRDLIIGVTAPGPDFRAHAWLDGDPHHTHEEFTELLRRPAT